MSMTEQIIQNLYRKYKTPLHVQGHMKLVAEVAVFLGKKIKRKNKKINIRFIRHLALLHDFLKMLVFKKQKKEDPIIWQKLRKKYPNTHDTEVAAKILKKMKEEKLARAIRTQQFDALISKTHPLKTDEEKIVYYADKLVAHTQVVTLEYRLKEGEKRYSFRTPRILRQKIFQLQKKICTKAGITPEILLIQKWKNVALTL